jgi:prephenate dehydrogenase
VVGVGLIGGSVGLALRERKLADRVVGVGRSDTGLREAVARGAIDEGTTELARGVAQAEVVVVCTPVDDVAATVRRTAAHGPRDVLVTDAGSTKHAIVEDVEGDERARLTFVGGHPIAGSERKGVQFAHARLFEERVCVLTPTARTPADRLERARGFWSELGTRLIELDPATHDEALALTSHLPHAVAAALAATVPVELLAFAAGAYRDGTRVAGADAHIWAAIFRENRGPLRAALGRFQEQLVAFRIALDSDDPRLLLSWWNAARDRRDRFQAAVRSSLPDTKPQDPPRDRLDLGET